MRACEATRPQGPEPGAQDTLATPEPAPLRKKPQCFVRVAPMSWGEGARPQEGSAGAGSLPSLTGSFGYCDRWTEGPQLDPVL